MNPDQDNSKNKISFRDIFKPSEAGNVELYEDRFNSVTEVEKCADMHPACGFGVLCEWCKWCGVIPPQEKVEKFYCGNCKGEVVANGEHICPPTEKCGKLILRLNDSAIPCPNKLPCPITELGGRHSGEPKPQEDWRGRFDEVLTPSNISGGYEHILKVRNECHSFLAKEIDAAEERGNKMLLEKLNEAVKAAESDGRLAERQRIKEALEVIPVKYWKDPAAKHHIIQAIEAIEKEEE